MSSHADSIASAQAGSAFSEFAQLDKFDEYEYKDIRDVPAIRPRASITDRIQLRAA